MPISIGGPHHCLRIKENYKAVEVYINWWKVKKRNQVIEEDDFCRVCGFDRLRLGLEFQNPPGRFRYPRQDK